MAEMVTYALREGVAVITVNNLPVNMLNRAVRAGLIAALERLADDNLARAAVLICKGRTFPAGADIRDFDAPDQAPHLPEVCNAIEASPKPIIACLHGTALGGGYELALACHGRLAVPGTRVGFPEVNLGVLPSAGGTQRLPRLVSIESALALLLGGSPVDVSAEPGAGFVDGLVEGDLLSAGIAHAQALATADLVPTRAKRQTFEGAFNYQQVVATARETHAGAPTRAPAAILDCVEAALLLPFDAGLDLERDLFRELRDTDEAKALRHGFLATREATKPPKGLPEPRGIHSVALVSGGMSGAGIAVACLDAGYTVQILERDGDTAQSVEAAVGDIYQRAISRGRLSATSRDDRLSRLSSVVGVEAVAEADFVIEAAPEDAEVKSGILQEISAFAKPDAIIVTNTSHLDIDELAEPSGRASNIIGIHFYPPAHVHKLVEVVIGTVTSPLTEATGFAVATALRKSPVRVSSSEGYIGNRVHDAYREAADRAVMAGASLSAVDAAMRDFGFKTGPYESIDREGLELAHTRQRRAEAQGVAPRIKLIDALIRAGRTGQRAGRGFYSYKQDPIEAHEDEEVTAILWAERGRLNMEARSLAPKDIQTDCLLAMMNEGAKLLDEGIAERAGDIDVVMLLGFGFPRYKGGPMKAAELAGLLPMLRELEKRAESDPFWTPAGALREAVKNGNRFSGVL